jgi:excisionase family DNA binding protein
MREKGLGAGSDVGIMTVHDVADYLRLSEAKVYKMANEGRVPALRMGKTWRFKKELIDEWIRRETELALHVS